MPRKGDDLSQVLVSKFVGNLVRVNTRSETEKPEVIPVVRECSLSTMMLVRAAIGPCNSAVTEMLNCSQKAADRKVGRRDRPERKTRSRRARAHMSSGWEGTEATPVRPLSQDTCERCQHNPSVNTCSLSFSDTHTTLDAYHFRMFAALMDPSTVRVDEAKHF